MFKHVFSGVLLLIVGLPSASSVFIPSAAPPTNATRTLANGASFPVVSFGLQVYGDDQAKALTLMAVGVGYRNIFRCGLRSCWCWWW